MAEKWNELKIQTLLPAEVEVLLAKEFGDKVAPVNRKELAKRQRAQEIQFKPLKTSSPR